MDKNPRRLAVFPTMERVAKQRMSELDEALVLSEALCDLATISDWSAMAEPQQERDRLLQAALSGEIPESFRSLAAQKLQQLLKMNENLTAIVVEAKRDLSRQFSHNKSKARIAERYLSNL